MRVEIYNGGLNEWQKNGYPITVIDPLPLYSMPEVDSRELNELLEDAQSKKCVNQEGRPVVTLLDLRTETNLQEVAEFLQIKTLCTIQPLLLDDLLKEHIREQIPVDSPVVIITETGMRNEYAARYLYKHGYTNVLGLKFGMRGWLKAGYPTHVIVPE